MKIFYYSAMISFLVSVGLYAEPSVYANSNFSSPEKSIAQNKKAITMLRHKVAQQTEQIDGLKSVVEGLSATLHELQQASQQRNLQNNHQDNQLLQTLGEMIDTINANYVSKDELHRALGDAPKVSTEKSITHKVEMADSNSLTQTYSQGVRLFVKKRYDEAKKRFILTEKEHYKPAPSNYYLGEISYYTKKYEDAIFYYKKSASLNDKASYIDTLLLHTAISLEKRGEKEQAKVFYENIISNYEGKKTAQIAKEKLEKL